MSNLKYKNSSGTYTELANLSDIGEVNYMYYSNTAPTVDGKIWCDTTTGITKLYWDGNEYTNITGGYIAKPGDPAELIKHSDYMQAVGTQTWTHVYTGNAIDLANYNKLCVEIEMVNGTGDGNVGTISSQGSDSYIDRHAFLDYRPFPKQVVEIAITNHNSNYIQFSMYNDDMRIYKIWLEKEAI